MLECDEADVVSERNKITPWQALIRQYGSKLRLYMSLVYPGASSLCTPRSEMSGGSAALVSIYALSRRVEKRLERKRSDLEACAVKVVDARWRY